MKSGLVYFSTEKFMKNAVGFWLDRNTVILQKKNNSTAAEFNSALFKSFGNVNSVLGGLGPSSVILYLNSSARGGVTSRFSKCYLFMILTVWERLSSSRFH